MVPTAIVAATRQIGQTHRRLAPSPSWQCRKAQQPDEPIRAFGALILPSPRRSRSVPPSAPAGRRQLVLPEAGRCRALPDKGPIRPGTLVPKLLGFESTAL